jgi:hypothetical protein
LKCLGRALELRAAEIKHGFYDVPDLKPFEPFCTPKRCRFSCYENWAKGESICISEGNCSCRGGSYWIGGVELEAEAAGLAAERITEEGVAALLKNVNEEFALSERAHEDGFYERAYELNMEFHQLIARASGNRRLADLIMRLMEDMRRMLAFDPRSVTPRQHLEIVEALKHGDRAEAEQAMKRHMEETKSRLLDRF